MNNDDTNDNDNDNDNINDINDINDTNDTNDYYISKIVWSQTCSCLFYWLQSDYNFTLYVIKTKYVINAQYVKININVLW